MNEMDGRLYIILYEIRGYKDLVYKTGTSDKENLKEPIDTEKYISGTPHIHCGGTMVGIHFYYNDYGSGYISRPIEDYLLF